MKCTSTFEWRSKFYTSQLFNTNPLAASFYLKTVTFLEMKEKMTNAVLCLMKSSTRTSRKGVQTLPNPVSVQRNDKILVEGYKDISENQGKMSSISLKYEEKAGKFLLSSGNPARGMPYVTILGFDSWHLSLQFCSILSKYDLN